MISAVLALSQEYRSHALHFTPSPTQGCRHSYIISSLLSTGSFLSVCKHIIYPTFKNEKNPYQLHLFFLQLPIFFSASLCSKTQQISGLPISYFFPLFPLNSLKLVFPPTVPLKLLLARLLINSSLLNPMCNSPSSPYLLCHHWTW